MEKNSATPREDSRPSISRSPTEYCRGEISSFSESTVPAERNKSPRSTLIGGITGESHVPSLWLRYRKHLSRITSFSSKKVRAVKLKAGYSSTGPSLGRASQFEFQKRVSVRYFRPIPKDVQNFLSPPT